MFEQLNIKEIKAEVHKAIHEGFRVKLLMPDVGMYINGMRVYPPNEQHPNEWVLLTPTIPPTKKRVVEFNPHLPLWERVKEVCIETVKDYMAGDPTPHHHKDVVIEDIDDEPVDFSKVPF